MADNHRRRCRSAPPFLRRRRGLGNHSVWPMHPGLQRAGPSFQSPNIQWQAQTPLPCYPHQFPPHRQPLQSPVVQPPTVHRQALEAPLLQPPTTHFEAIVALAPLTQEQAAPRPALPPTSMQRQAARASLLESYLALGRSVVPTPPPIGSVHPPLPMQRQAAPAPIQESGRTEAPPVDPTPPLRGSVQPLFGMQMRQAPPAPTQESGLIVAPPAPATPPRRWSVQPLERMQRQAAPAPIQEFTLTVAPPNPLSGSGQPHLSMQRQAAPAVHAVAPPPPAPTETVNTLTPPNDNRGICQNFRRTGICKYGTSCKKRHPDEHRMTSYPHRPEADPCMYFTATGFCPNGLKCRCHHPTDKIKPAEMAPEVTRTGFARRPGMEKCRRHQLRRCSLRAYCKFDHPDE